MHSDGRERGWGSRARPEGGGGRASPSSCRRAGPTERASIPGLRGASMRSSGRTAPSSRTRVKILNGVHPAGSYGRDDTACRRAGRLTSPSSARAKANNNRLCSLRRFEVPSSISDLSLNSPTPVAENVFLFSRPDDSRSRLGSWAPRVVSIVGRRRSFADFRPRFPRRVPRVARLADWRRQRHQSRHGFVPRSHLTNGRACSFFTLLPLLFRYSIGAESDAPFPPPENASRGSGDD